MGIGRRRQHFTTIVWFRLACRIKTVLAVLAVLAVLVPVLAAPSGASGAEIGPEAMADIARIEEYLNRINTLQARFLQISSNGSYSEGQLSISRPGKMRIEYDPPVPVLIVADGTWMIYYDSKLEQVSYIPLSSTPAGILVREKISFSSDDLTLTGFERSANALRLTLVMADDPQAGSMTLVFSDQPLMLKKWHIIDAQGVATTVSLLKTRFGLPLNPELFHFRNPNQGASRDTP